MEQNKKLGALLVGFIFLVLGAVFIGAIADSQVAATQTNTVTNESMTLVNATPVQSDHRQWLSVTRVGNTSRTLTENLDYTVNLQQGQVTLTAPNTTIAAIAYDVSYTYTEVQDSGSRALLTVIVIFFAIAILLGVFAMLSPTFREMMGNLGR